MRTLFIAYQEASNPLMMYSQGLPYIYGLRERGVDFSLFTFETQESLRQSKTLLDNQRCLLRWYFCFYCMGPRIIANMIDMLVGMVGVFWIILKDKIDIVHARGSIAAIIAFVPVKLMKKKLLFDTRGFLSDKYVAGALIKRRSFIYRIMKRVELYVYSRADFSTVETERHLSLLNRWSPALSHKASVVPCCIDTDFFQDHCLEFPRSEFVFIYLGKSGTWHKVGEMFDFFKTACSLDSRCRFVFITQDDPGIINDIARIHLVDSAKLKIIKPDRQELPFLLSAGSAGIMFIDPSHAYNSSHIKFGEYLACGLPVLVNVGIGDTHRIISKNQVGVVVRQQNSCGYADSFMEMKKLIATGRDVRRRCVQAARDNFSLKSGVEGYLMIYNKLCR